MATPPLKRSKEKVPDVCRLARLLLDAAKEMQQINYEIQQGAVDFNQLDLTSIGLTELTNQSFYNLAAASDTFVNDNLVNFARLSSHGRN